MEDPRINVVSLTVRRRTVWDVKCYRVNMGVFGKKKKKDSVEICSCNTTKTTEIIAKENLHPWWGILGRRELHRPCYFPLDLTGSMQMRKSNTRLFSCPRCPCQIRNSPLVINFHSSKASYRGKKKKWPSVRHTEFVLREFLIQADESS